MNICMIVHNNGTRDGRVMREAHTLRAAGHAVSVVGIPESGVTKPQELLEDGITVLRVDWYEKARRRFRRSGWPRAFLFGTIGIAMAYALYRLSVRIYAVARPVAEMSIANLMRAVRSATPAEVLIVLLLLVGAIFALWGAVAFARAQTARRRQQKELTRRRMISGAAPSGERFPAIRSRIPSWIPDWVLEFGLEPFGWLGARMARFSLQRYRSEEIAAAAIRLKPDVVHCHDCIALPTGWLVKKALNIPLVYDAHEIYEAVAAGRLGATDYFARVHQKYLPRIDGFVAVNESAANYYRLAYPAAPRAVVIRNAMNPAALGPYDGRLHRAAGLPLDEKILIYQGGFTKLRGLPTLVSAAALLPEGWSLVMMGSGPLTDELKALAQSRGGARPAKAHFIPAVPSNELLAWTQGATAGIVPYEDKVLNHWIATPNKLWEYPNAGVPMIVQPFFEMRRIVETYGCGWLLPDEFTPAAIAALVASLSDQMFADAREGCRRFMAADNWISIYQGRLLQLYESLGRQVERKRNAAIKHTAAIAQ